MSNIKRSFCWNCWLDWKETFLDLSPWEQEQFLESNPRVNPNDFERGKCPYCGARYDDDLDAWFEDLLMENEDWVTDEEDDF